MSRARRFARLALAELVAMRGRRLAWCAAVATLGSFAGGLAMGALVVPFAGAIDPAEASTVVVSRGSAAQAAVAVLAGLAIAAPYRDGSWMHAALAAPSPMRRLLAGAVPVLALALGLGGLAIAAAAAGASLVEPGALAALPAAAGIHLAVVGVWTWWMLCLAHASRSALATLAVGQGLPLVVEPALAGLLAQTAMADARWALLPSLALRSLGELPSGGGAVLDGPPPEQAPLLLVALTAWTAAATVVAWLRARRAQPR